MTFEEARKKKKQELKVGDPEVEKKILLTNYQKDPKYDIKPDKKLFPLSIVWCSLPGFTWVLPPVGHVGIGDADGFIHDFDDIFELSINNFTYGDPDKYVPIKVCVRIPGGRVRYYNSHDGENCEIAQQLVHDFLDDNNDL